MSDEYFHGYALNAVDAKSRLSIPADYRDVIQARSASKDLRLAPSRHAPCLIGYDKSYFARLKADHDARFAAQSNRERDRDATAIFAGVTPLTIDDAGRIVLPPVLRKLRGIRSHVWFVAGGDFFEAWNPWTYLGHDDADPALVEMLRFELDAKKLPLVEPEAAA